MWVEGERDREGSREKKSERENKAEMEREIVERERGTDAMPLPIIPSVFLGTP